MQDMQNPSEEPVKVLLVHEYEHTEAGVDLVLRDMTVELLNEEDFDIIPDDFDPLDHEHSIPQFEMARVFLLLCAKTGQSLGIKPSDRTEDPEVYAVYENAYQRQLQLETDRRTLLALAKIGLECGFASHAAPESQA